MKYDQNNTFAKILRKEIPADVVYENEYALSFHDINPKAPIHVLVIPKGNFISFFDFAAGASPELMIGFNKAIYHVICTLTLEESGFRILSNNGLHGGQEVPHYHVHILGGCLLGRIISPP
jgi:histidine triad (HIT) family protein